MIIRELIVNPLEFMGGDLSICQSARICYGNYSDTTSFSLIHHLIKNKHTTPLESPHFKLEFIYPLCIDRQLMTYRMRSAPLSPSARYGADDKLAKYLGGDICEPTLFVPTDIPDDSIDFKAIYNKILVLCDGVEAHLIDKKIDPKRRNEIIRFLMPQGQVVTRHVIFNLHQLFHILDQRDSPHAQREWVTICKRLKEIIAHTCPVALECYIANRAEQ